MAPHTLWLQSVEADPQEGRFGIPQAGYPGHCRCWLGAECRRGRGRKKAEKDTSGGHVTGRRNDRPSPCFDTNMLVCLLMTHCVFLFLFPLVIYIRCIGSGRPHSQSSPERAARRGESSRGTERGLRQGDGVPGMGRCIVLRGSVTSSGGCGLRGAAGRAYGGAGPRWGLGGCVTPGPRSQTLACPWIRGPQRPSRRQGEAWTHPGHTQRAGQVLPLVTHLSGKGQLPLPARIRGQVCACLPDGTLAGWRLRQDSAATEVGGGEFCLTRCVP